MKHADDLALNEVIGLIEAAKEPMIYCGGGIISGEASAELREFAERTQIPVATTLDGHRLFSRRPSALAEMARACTARCMPTTR